MLGHEDALGVVFWVSELVYKILRLRAEPDEASLLWLKLHSPYDKTLLQLLVDDKEYLYLLHHEGEVVAVLHVVDVEIPGSRERPGVGEGLVEDGGEAVNTAAQSLWHAYALLTGYLGELDVDVEL